MEKSTIVKEIESLNNFLYIVYSLIITFFFLLFGIMSIYKQDLNLLIIPYPFLILIFILTRLNYLRWNKNIKKIEEKCK